MCYVCLFRFELRMFDLELGGFLINLWVIVYEIVFCIFGEI